ncbi:MAG: 30S ribosomal protein S20 [Candidatus Cloacimonadota bacterium]|nr:30S ribosomal protein S20 [Candidatus Cloacimonadota bacterium]
MPSHKSCEKRIRSDAKKRERNHYLKKSIRTLIKKFKSADEKEKMKELLSAIYSIVDKAAKTNVIHKNKAARQKARLTKYYNNY